MEDFLEPLLWSLEKNTVECLTKTPIFNEGIARKGYEFHSALALVSFPTNSGPPSPPVSDAFHMTEIDVLARSSNCQVCVEQQNSKPCKHCKDCIDKGEVKSVCIGHCPHVKCVECD